MQQAHAPEKPCQPEALVRSFVAIVQRGVADRRLYC